jgi:hypothetical protein
VVSSEDVKEEFPYGLEVLYEPETPPPPAKPVQIVFVHGLGGSKRGTWSDSEKNKNFWPTWLHDEKGLENIRIATFGYNSSFHFLAPNRDLCIPIFANQLLLSLNLHGYRSGTVRTPYTELMIGGDDFRSPQLGGTGGQTGTPLFDTL